MPHLSEKGHWFLAELLGIADVAEDDLVKGAAGRKESRFRPFWRLQYCSSDRTVQAMMTQLPTHRFSPLRRASSCIMPRITIGPRTAYSALITF